MLDPESERLIVDKAFRTIMTIRAINNIKTRAIDIFKEEQMKPIKPVKKMKKPKSIILTLGLCLAFITSSCAPTHTAIIHCKTPMVVEDCVREDLGKKVKIIRISKIDISTYMVDYK